MRGPKPKTITIRGETFKSAKEAAAHYGLGTSSIHAAMREGRLDDVGLPSKGKPIPFMIGPYQFRSKRAASIALGLGPSFIQNAMREGSIVQLRILARIMSQYVKARAQS